MKQQRIDMAKIIIMLVCIILVVFAVIAIVFAAEVVSNKNSQAVYEKLNKTDRKLLETVNEYLTNDDGTKIKLDKPVAFMKNNGIFRGRAYVFNVNLTEHKLNYGLNGGTYATEILLPEDYSYSFPTMYRCSSVAPKLGALLFPNDFSTVELCDKEVYVICYNDDMLSDGTFTTLLDRVFDK